MLKGNPQTLFRDPGAAESGLEEGSVIGRLQFSEEIWQGLMHLDGTLDWVEDLFP